MPEFNMKEFLDQFEKAINAVEQEYYMIQTVYNELGVPRERVFCYELYHQLRCVINQDFLKIHGELDKGGHEDFREALERVKPDFLFHTPGTHDHNAVVVEVKGELCDTEALVRDIRKIYFMLSNKIIHYSYGIFLLYNYCFEDLTACIKDKVSNIPPDFDEKVYILAKEGFGEECGRCTLAELRIMSKL